MYHQPIHTLCNVNPCTIPLNAYDLTISYVERHDSDTVEFSHKHVGEYEIYYVINGGLENQVNNQLQRIESGHFLFINKDIAHGTIYRKDENKQYFTICFDFLKKRLSQGGRSASGDSDIELFLRAVENKDYLIWEDSENCKHLIDIMQEEFDKRPWGWLYRLQNLYAEFLFIAFRSLMNSLKMSSKSVEQTEEKNLPIKFTHFLHANYPNPDLSAQDLADHFYMSQRHVNRLFAEYFGNSVAKTLTLYRINYTKDYLINTDLSVDEVSEKVGFKSGNTLSRLFKQIEGITISEFKKINKESRRNDI